MRLLKVCGGASLLAVLVAALMAGSALAQGSGVTGSVTVQDQTSAGSTVVVPQAVVSGSNGWIAIHSDQDGSPGPVIGEAYIPEGTSTNVTVQLNQSLSSSQQLYAMIHTDDPADQTYTFPEDNTTDVPVMADGQVVVKPFQVTIGEGGLPETGGFPVSSSLALMGSALLLSLGLATGYLARRRA